MEFVNFDEAKKRLGKSSEELQALIKGNEIRAFRDGDAWKFRKEDIDKMAGGPAEDEGGEDAGDTLMSIDADILFAEEEEVPADSAAETWIAADTEGVFPGGAAPGEERPLGVEEALAAPEAEPAPLALSPESDDTSLGAVLSEEELGAEEDVLGEEPVIAVDADSGLATVVPGSGSGTSAVAPSRTRIVTLVEPEAHHEPYTFMLAIAALGLGLALLAMMALFAESMPSVLVAIGEGGTGLAVLGGGIGAVLVAALVGYVLDKQRAARDALG